MLIPIYWSVQCILMDLNGEFAQTLFQRSYGNLTIPKVTIQKWNRNVAGIQFLQVNALNAAPHFHGCDYPHSNGAVNVVVGKMISKPSLPRLLLAINTIHITTFNIVDRIQYRRRSRHDIALFTTQIQTTKTTYSYNF